MSKALIFTATARPGGLAETYASLLRQDFDGEIIWAISDELYELRQEIVAEKVKDVELIHFRLPKKEGYLRNLAAGDNEALRYARELEVDLLISLQDYIWIPDDGISKFATFAKKRPDALIGGLCSWAGQPDFIYIHDKKGLWTIFKEPYLDKPKDITWYDCRDANLETGERQATGFEWEANWGALGPWVFEDTSLNFDEEYDKGVSFENQDYSLRAETFGYPTFVIDNHALCFPHKAYWPEEEERDIPLLNIKMHHEKWNIPLPPDWAHVEA